MVAPGGSSGKSIVIMISISYFLRPYGPPARPARDARRGRALDVGIVSLPVRERELAVSPFYRDEVVAIAPPDRRWRRGRRAAARDLVSAPLILFERGATLRRVIDDWFRRAGEVPAAAMELGNTEAIKKLVEAGPRRSVTPWVWGGA